MNYTYDMATTTLMINNQFVASQRAFFDIWLGMFRLMAIWLGVLVVLGIIALVVWLVIRNKRKASSVPAQDPNLKTPGLQSVGDSKLGSRYHFASSKFWHRLRDSRTYLRFGSKE